MCEPTTLMVIGTLVGGVSQYMSGQAQANAAEYSAKVNDYNAQQAERRARDALLRGAEEEQRVRMEGSQLKGKQVAGMAAAGLDLGFGSPLDVLVDTTVGIELDAARTRRNAQLEAEDFDQQAWNYRTQGELDRYSASSARTGAFLGAAGTVLGGAADIRKYQYEVSIG